MRRVRSFAQMRRQPGIMLPLTVLSLIALLQIANVFKYNRRIIQTVIASAIDPNYPLAAATVNNDTSLVTVIDLDRMSSLISDISSISHDPSKTLIKVHLNKERKCAKPVFRGRLSGPYLAIINWDALNSDISQLIGHYQVPSSGKYHLEIITLFCDEDIFKSDMKSCLENPDYHRITAKTASIIVTQVHESYNDTVGLGSWSYHHEQSVSEEIQAQQDHVPLFTRYQPISTNCRGKNATKNRRCTVPMDIQRFKPYHFKWNKKTEQALSSLQNVVVKPEKLCFVGWSHLPILATYMKDTLVQYNLHPNVRLEQHRAKYLRDGNATFVANMFASDCTKILFGFGQWDGLIFTSFDDWRKGISNIIAHTKSLNKARHPGDEIDIFITAAHYNPVGDAKTWCPPHDAKSPPVIDAYNAISKQLCDKENHDVIFIDTNSAVIGPVWDRAADWCHYVGKSLK